MLGLVVAQGDIIPPARTLQALDAGSRAATRRRRRRPSDEDSLGKIRKVAGEVVLNKMHVPPYDPQ